MTVQPVKASVSQDLSLHSAPESQKVVKKKVVAVAALKQYDSQLALAYSRDVKGGVKKGEGGEEGERECSDCSGRT